MAARVAELTALLVRDTSDFFVALDRVGSPYTLMKEYLRKILRCQLEGVELLAEPNPDMYQFLLIVENAVSTDYDFKDFLEEHYQQEGIFWPFFFWVAETRCKINFIDHAHHHVMCLTTRQFRENRRYYRSDLLDHELATPDLVVCVEMWDKLTASMDSFRLKYFPDDILIPKELIDRRSIERRSLLRLFATPSPSQPGDHDGIDGENKDDDEHDGDGRNEEEEEDDRTVIIEDGEDADVDSVILDEDENSVVEEEEMNNHHPE